MKLAASIKSIAFAAAAVMCADSALAATQTGLDSATPFNSGFASIEELGWSFTTASDDLIVTGLGFYASGAGSTTITLWDSMGGVVATTGLVSSTAAGWTYFDLAASASLSAGEVYTVSYTAGDVQAVFGADGSTVATVNFTVNPALTLISGLAGNAGAIPDETVNGGIYYADIVFTTDVPLPAALPLMLTGLGVVGVISRRRRAA